MTIPSAATANAAIKTIAAYPKRLDEASGAVAGIPKGPWAISVHCSYGSSCCDHHATYSMSTSLSSSTLTSIITTATNHAKTFATSFKDVHEWLVSLPSFSDIFATNSQDIVKLLSSLPPSQKPDAAQRQRLTSWFAPILKGLGTANTQLENGSQGISQFLTIQIGIGQQLDEAERGLVTTAAAGLAALQEDISQKPCGKAEAEAQFQAVAALNNESVGRFQSEFATLNSQTGDANTAVGTVLSLVAGFQAEITKINASIATASVGELSNFLTQLDVQAAASMWNQLAAAAQQSLTLDGAAIDHLLVAS